MGRPSLILLAYKSWKRGAILTLSLKGVSQEEDRTDPEATLKEWGELNTVVQPNVGCGFGL